MQIITQLSAKTKILIKVAVFAVAFRLAVYFLSYCIMILHGDYAAQYSFADFIAGWQRWDALHYLRIADLGYAGYTEDGKFLMLVFFPLYPALLRLISGLIPNLPLVGMLVSTLAYAGGCCYLYSWAEEESGKAAAQSAVILLSTFPFAFFFGGIMTESVFLLVSMGALCHLKKKQWLAGGIFLFLAALTRLQGMLLFLPALAEVAVSAHPLRLMKTKQWTAILRTAVRALLLGCSTLAGIGVYLAINARVSGNPLQFTVYQREHWFQGLGFLPDTLHYIWENAVNERFNSIGMAIWIPELVLFAVGVLLLLYGIRRQRISVSLYLGAYLVCIYSATWLLSAGRYLSCAVPLFMIAGEWLAKRGKWRLAVYWLSGALFIIYLTAYITGKQVM